MKQKENQREVRDDKVNPDKVESAREMMAFFEQARREGRLVEIPLTEEEKRPVLLEDNKGEDEKLT